MCDNPSTQPVRERRQPAAADRAVAAAAAGKEAAAAAGKASAAAAAAAAGKEAAAAAAVPSPGRRLPGLLGRCRFWQGSCSSNRSNTPSKQQQQQQRKRLRQLCVAFDRLGGLSAVTAVTFFVHLCASMRENL